MSDQSQRRMAPLAVGRGFWAGVRHRYTRNRVRVVAGVVAALILSVSLAAPLVSATRYDVANIAESLRPPSLRHWLGTDAIGRDVLSRLLYGGRSSLEVAIAVVGLAVLVGAPLGILAGLKGGRADYAVLRLVEITTAVPSLLFAMLLISVLGNGMGNLIIAIASTAWIESCRLMRAQTLTIRRREYMEAARAAGATTRRLVRHHLIPNALGPLIVVITISIPRVIFIEAGLSFLGLGINDPLPTWGKMVSESVGYLNVYPALGIAPTVMIAVTVLCFTLVGDGLRDALDPSR